MMITVPRIFSLIFTLGLLALVAQPQTIDAAEIRTLKGETLQGSLKSVGPDGITLETSGKEIRLPLTDLVSIDLKPGAALPKDAFAMVELSDGSKVVAKSAQILGEEVSLALHQGSTIRIPVTATSWVLLKAQSPKDRLAWNEKLLKKRKRDVVAVLKKDADNPDGILNMVEGTLGKGDPEGKTIEFAPAGANKAIPVPQTNLFGLVYLRALDANARPVICKVIDMQQSEFLVSALSIDKQSMKLTTSTGTAFELPLDSIHKVDFSRGKLAYLSDMEPSRLVLTMDEDRISTFRKDTNLDGGPLKIQGTIYPKGLSMLATTEVEYDLKGEYREFHALTGFDDLVGGIDDKVILEIDGDGKQLAKLELSRSDKLRVKPIHLAIKDVQRLRIVVRSPGALDFGRHIDLVNPQVSK